MRKSAIKSMMKATGMEWAIRALYHRIPWARRVVATHRVRKLINDPVFRDAWVSRHFEQFNGGRIEAKLENELRIMCLWEINERMKWLDHGNDDPNCRIFYLSRAAFDPVWNKLLARYKKEMAAELHMGEVAIEVYSRGHHAEYRQRFVEYCKSVVAGLTATYKIDVILLPKVNDDWTIDLILAIQELDVTLVIDDREDVSTPKRLEVVPPKLKRLLGFDLDLLNCHNLIHRDFFIDSGFNEDKIVVLGDLTTDYWFRPDLHKCRPEIHPDLSEHRIVVLFFSFGPKQVMNTYYEKEQRNWMDLCDAFHEAMLHILRKYGDRVQIVYKTGGKPARDLYPGHDDFMKKARPYRNGKNLLKLDYRYPVLDLIRTSDIVLGFQTKGLFEAMFTDNPIVFGAWGDLFEDIKDSLHPLHDTEAVTHARSTEELTEVLGRLVENPGTFKLTDRAAAARKALRGRFFHQPDGRVASRILAATKQAHQERLRRKEEAQHAITAGEASSR